MNPKLPWQVILSKFLDRKIKENYSWARRNRRYVSSIYMPSLYSEGLGNLTFAIDTSGSIEDDELQEMLSEIQGIQQVFNPETMKIIDCDSTIHEIHEIDQSTNISTSDNKQQQQRAWRSQGCPNFKEHASCTKDIKNKK